MLYTCCAVVDGKHFVNECIRTDILGTIVVVCCVDRKPRRGYSGSERRGPNAYVNIFLLSHTHTYICMCMKHRYLNAAHTHTPFPSLIQRFEHE